MIARYAGVIVDGKVEALDRVFSYRIPAALADRIRPGVRVRVPFGKGDHEKAGYVVTLSDRTDVPDEKIKDLLGVKDLTGDAAEIRVALAAWMRGEYGCTMSQALKVCLPPAKAAQVRIQRILHLAADRDQAKALLAEAERKKHHAKARLIAALIEDPSVPQSAVTGRLQITRPTIDALVRDGVIRVEEREITGPAQPETERVKITLNPDQQHIADEIWQGYTHGDSRPSLIYGITGSGKTEIYLELMERVIAQGKQVILLIPEISLTYQTLMRFYRRLGHRVSYVHSRLTPAEKAEQFARAADGEIDVMIGPRSALFTPFAKLGCIIVDEEHDDAYQSDQTPRYHAVETAFHLGELTGSLVIAGSATPSIDRYDRAIKGELRLFSLTRRAHEGALLPDVTVCDMREEMKNKNRSIFSAPLREAIEGCLERHEQMMLFLNRRGFSGFVSCRSCGTPLTCPHCDISLTAHRDGRLRCHYCGYTRILPKQCPVCGSEYLAGFGMGTEKAEELVKQAFPGIRTLRMDADTTSGKDGHSQILRAFGAGEADVLIGTQMIVKGHDFPAVTLVGILMADLSLYSADYRASEKTFGLLTQAAGRAGRADLPGQVIIQTYNPEHYAIQCAALQDYPAFYEQEIAYRQLMHYPPCGYLMNVQFASPDERTAERAADDCAAFLKRQPETSAYKMAVIGPGSPQVSKIKDQYYRHLIVKAEDKTALAALREAILRREAGPRVWLTCEIR